MPRGAIGWEDMKPQAIQVGLHRSTSRRRFVRALACGVLAMPALRVRAASPVTFGLTPVFLDSDLELLKMLATYLSDSLGREVSLIKRRTYQEITAMLLSGQLDAAWICDDPYVQHRDKLALLAVPLYLHKPLYQTYIAVNNTCKAQTFDDLRGTIHAFSDPDSTSGYLITRYLLTLRKTTPNDFFSSSFFTYGHRNVIRAVGAGLADSGSIDGYVWDVMNEREPQLVKNTRIIYRSEWLGFPPIVGLQTARNTPVADAIATAFLGMASRDLGRSVLAILQLDGFVTATPDLYDSTMEKWLAVKAQV